MKISKHEKKQVKLVDDWNKNHPVVGIDVIVKKDDETEQNTKTRSAAWMLGATGTYPGHTAVILLEGISGCYTLERVRPRLAKAPGTAQITDSCDKPVNVPQPIKILQTDRLFIDSPNVGDPACLCSRCGLAIPDGIGIIRAWPAEKSEGEYRYHPKCLNGESNV